MNVPRFGPDNIAPFEFQTIWDRLSSPEPNAAVQKPSQAPPTHTSEKRLGCNFVFEASPTNPTRFTSPTNSRWSITPMTSRANTRNSTLSPELVIHSVETPLPTYSTRGHDELDPDFPLPSVERRMSLTGRSSRRSLSSTRSNTPTTRESICRTPAPQSGNIDKEDLERFQDLTLRSLPPQVSVPSRSTTSIDVTPSVIDTNASRSRVERSDSPTEGVSSLDLHAGDGRTHSASVMLEDPSLSPAFGATESVYKVEDEMTTDALSNLPEAYIALDKARSLTKNLEQNLSNSEMSLDSESSIAKLCKQARELDNFELPSSRIVGVVGDAGTGKSSLINSLLDHEGIATQGGRGIACTSTVTEFVFHDRDDFILEVEFLSMVDLETHFMELLSSYRDARKLRNTSDSPDNVDLQQKAKYAKEVFQTSFEEKLCDIDSMLSSVSIEVAAQRMVNWTEDLIPSQKVRNTYATMEACAARLAGLGRDLASQRCVPFIRTSRVFLKAFILSQGLVLADLPGLRDISTIRQAITERYMLNCHQVFVVADMVRPVTNSSIEEVFNLAHRVKLSNIDIICTKSDEISVTTACSDWPERRRELEELRNKRETANQSIKKMEADIKNLTPKNRTWEVQQGLLECYETKHKLEASLEDTGFDERFLITTTRNQDVTEKLRRHYRSKALGPTPNIFCVSSAMYTEKRKYPMSQAMPFIELSNIPKLRQYCITIVAQSRIEAIKQFIEHKLPALINSIQLWVETGSGSRDAQKKQSTLEAVSSIQQEVDALSSTESLLSQLSENLHEAFQRCIYQLLKKGENRWSNEARKICETWRDLNHMTARACCARGGQVFRSSTNMVYFWNAEATSNMNGDMRAAWDNFKSSIVEEFTRMYATIDESFQKMLVVTSKHGLRTLAKSIRHKESLMIYGLQGNVHHLDKSLASLYADAFGSVQNGLIFELMRTTYEGALMDTGSGCGKRRIQSIVSRFGSKQLFIEHRREMRNLFRELTETFQGDIDKDLETHFRSIKQDLDILKNENSILESERNPWLRTELQIIATKAKHELAEISQSVGSSP